MFRVLRALVSTVVLVMVASLPVAAHPLGNFTINHLTKLRFGHDGVALRYVLDMAEIPTYQAMRDASSTGRLGAHELRAWGQAEATTLLPQLLLSDGGRAIAFRLEHVAIRTRPGAGGLPTIYLTLDARAALPVAPQATLTFRDTTFAGRLGWHDVAVAPQTEPTHELLAYPSALLGSPRATTAVSMALGPGASATVRPLDGSATTATAGSAPASIGRTNQLSDLLQKGTSDPRLVALTFLVAIALGALHALEPGHGKTLLAVSLVGARATVKQAAILASALTVAHTIGVLALGVAINLFKGYFVPETIYPWITLISGVAIAIIGARAVQKQILARRPVAHLHAHGHVATHPHEHTHVHHVHASGAEHVHDDPGHAHGHAHGEHGNAHGHDDLEHARSHAIPGSAPLTFGGTVWAAMSGGVAPCPAALVVLLAAIALNQVAYGIFVIVAFSFGLAVTLTGLGIAVVRGAGWLQRRRQFDRVVHLGPLVSAVVISTIGAIMVGQGFAQQGITISPLAITGAVALAIAGYAFSHPFAAHRTEIA